MSKGVRVIYGKGFGSKRVAGSALTQASGKLSPRSGQKARVEALREDRTSRVKEALSSASARSELFKPAG